MVRNLLGPYRAAISWVPVRSTASVGLNASCEGAWVLVRPDGHIALIVESENLLGLRTYLDRWLPTAMGIPDAPLSAALGGIVRSTAGPCAQVAFSSAARASTVLT